MVNANANANATQGRAGQWQGVHKGSGHSAGAIVPAALDPWDIRTSPHSRSSRTPGQPLSHCEPTQSGPVDPCWPHPFFPTACAGKEYCAVSRTTSAACHTIAIDCTGNASEAVTAVAVLTPSTDCCTTLPPSDAPKLLSICSNALKLRTIAVSCLALPCLALPWRAARQSQAVRRSERCTRSVATQRRSSSILKAAKQQPLQAAAAQPATL